MSKVLSQYEQEAIDSLMKTLKIPGRRLSLLGVLTMADLRLRRIEKEFELMRGFAAVAVQGIQHNGKDDCPRCRIEKEYGIVPTWRCLMAEDKYGEISLEHHFASVSGCPMGKKDT